MWSERTFMGIYSSDETAGFTYRWIIGRKDTAGVGG